MSDHFSPAFRAGGGGALIFVDKMSILAPEHVKEAYAGYLEEALNDVLGED